MTFAEADRLNVTVTAARSAAALDFGRADIVATVQTMQRTQCYKSMTSYEDHRSWQAVYHVPSEAGMLYIKFVADIVSEFVLLSFRREAMDEYVHPEAGASLHRDVRPMTPIYKGQSITVDMPGWYSEQSDEGVLTGEDMKISDRALNRLKARTEGLLEPEEIKRIRKKLSLTQEVAGDVIGGGPRAFQRYESGDLPPSRAIRALSA